MTLYSLRNKDHNRKGGSRAGGEQRRGLRMKALMRARELDLHVDTEFL